MFVELGIRFLHDSKFKTVSLNLLSTFIVKILLFLVYYLNDYEFYVLGLSFRNKILIGQTVSWLDI